MTNVAPARPLRLCFVAHRAAPHPGGTEVYVQSMAEAAMARGHAATILAGQHRGDLNGVRITGDESVLERERFDLIVVHAATDGPPRNTLERAGTLPSPVLFQLVAHRSHRFRHHHLAAARLIGWSTPLDRAIITRHGFEARAARLRHGIRLDDALGAPGFRARHGIGADQVMFLSCGGYAPHKRMRPLARLFERAGRKDALLVTTGYAARRGALPTVGPRVMPLILEDRAEVLSAMAEADCYLMHSRDEGFGLVLLEAMLNRTPWISHATGGATALGHLGQVYRRDDELVALIRGFARDEAQVARAEAEVRAEHAIGRVIDDIEAAVARIAAEGPVPPLGTRPGLAGWIARALGRGAPTL